jgi:hypothetical protein
MRSSLGLAAVAAAAAVLTACTSIPTSAADVCNIHASWVSAGRPVDDQERMATSIENAIADEGSRVDVAARQFLSQVERDDPAGIASASEQLDAACVADGWEPAEG